MKKMITVLAWIIFFPFMLAYWGWKNKKKPAMIIGIVMSAFIIIVAVTPSEVVEEPVATEITEEPAVEEVAEEPAVEEVAEEPAVEEVAEEPVAEEGTEKVSFDGYTLIEVAGGDLSGYRGENVVVDIGFGDREYWAFTNEYGQLVRVVADTVILQDEENEEVLSTGRYYSDEAKVPGTESKYLDEGHIIADSLGGVANAYNITPQESTLNRHGDQAYMEKNIRDANGCRNFEAIISYPNNETQIPSHYQYTYTLMGNLIVDSFDNINPEGSVVEEPVVEEPVVEEPVAEDISHIDTNGNGTVTIKEAKEAGFTMPISSDHWLYKYMNDNDGDGKVGE